MLANFYTNTFKFYDFILPNVMAIVLLAFLMFASSWMIVIPCFLAVEIALSKQITRVLTHWCSSEDKENDKWYSYNSQFSNIPQKSRLVSPWE